MTPAEAGAVLATEAARFHAMGWMRGTSGNLSVVLEREPLRIAVTASGVDKGEMSADHFVVVDGDGRALQDHAPQRRPSAEAALHARIARRTGAGAVVHVHSVSSVRAGELHPGGIVLRGLEMLKGIGRDAHDDTVVIPVIDNTQDMSQLADRFEQRWDGLTPAFVVAHHGLYVWGTDHTQARHYTEAVEWLLELVAARG
jgi:methylthioribulose-1-phosphate dehydratase